MRPFNKTFEQKKEQHQDLYHYYSFIPSSKPIPSLTSPIRSDDQDEKRSYQSIKEADLVLNIHQQSNYYYLNNSPALTTTAYSTSPLLVKHEKTSSTTYNVISAAKDDYSSSVDANRWNYTTTSWFSQVWLYLSYFLLTSRQKEKSTPRTLILRARRKGIRILCTVIFFAISSYFIQRFIGHYIHFEVLPSETAADLIQSIPSADHIRHHFSTYAAQPHLAGSDQDKHLAEWTRDTWIRDYGLNDTEIETYYPTLNYPRRRRLAIIKGPEHLLYEAVLDTDTTDSHEEGPSGQHTAATEAYQRKSRGTATPAFHAYSGNGNVTGPLVYVNYGRLIDFDSLTQQGILLNGTIALIRQGGGITMGSKVKMAEEQGCVGVILFSDMARVVSSLSTISPTLYSYVERGSVQYNSIGVGDPFTPNFAATENITRMPYDELTNIPKIPSLPISWKDAQPFLKALEGHGFASRQPEHMLFDKNRSYHSGPSEALVNLINLNEYQIRPIYNVISKIEGSEYPDRIVMIGNHRDAWSYGAIDASSGSAVMMELVRTIGILVSRGWKPKRTIMIASWDAKEYGAIGSTEWIEDNASWLKERLVAYLNVDHAVSGKQFVAQASPLLSRLLYQVTNEVIDPQTSQTVYERWKKDSLRLRQQHAQDKMISTIVKKEHEGTQNGNQLSPQFLAPLIDMLEPSLDHTAFFHHLGVSSLSIGFRNKEINDTLMQNTSTTEGVFSLRHSNLDTIQHMLSSDDIDPLFEYHQTLTRIWGLLLLRLASDPILPMLTHDYTNNIVQALQQLNNAALSTTSLTSLTSTALSNVQRDGNIRNCFTTMFPFISATLPSLSYTSIQFDRRLEKWARQWIIKKKHVSRKLQERVADANDRLMRFERAFCDEAGLNPPESRWLKHRIYGPHIRTGMAIQFPGLVEAVEEGNLERIKWVEERIGKSFIEAERVLKGQQRQHIDENADIMMDNNEDEDDQY
ncbi:hypothetical protein BDF20DRAFT_941693 [Mycotypha africana]|uniref:uncharacterized protein n=1 Tax=Mycotypha africana TaxID=64632 RepID=UPI0023009CC4|nr:uncharacterized protein BDF20DRAFT_941693 [Mycotypha africana]KAI8977235.1 hypothetical protein BDF20DRAFT_941693 [Mycotypha africana]